MTSSAGLVTGVVFFVVVSTLCDARNVAIPGKYSYSSQAAENAEIVLEDPATSELFNRAPLHTLVGPWFVCWTDAPEVHGVSTFGRCDLDGDGNVEAYFPYGGDDIKWPSTWSAVLSAGVFWGIHDCSGGLLAEKDGYAAVNVCVDDFSNCEGWTVGTYQPSTGDVWFGCEGKEVWADMNSIPEGDIFPLCIEGGSSLALQHTA